MWWDLIAGPCLAVLGKTWSPLQLLRAGPWAVCGVVGGGDWGGRGGEMQVEEGWVGGETAKDMGPLAWWVWRRLGCYMAGGWGGELPSAPRTVAQAMATPPHSA